MLALLSNPETPRHSFGARRVGTQIVVLASLLPACTASVPSRPPTASEAEGFLSEVVTIARSGDFAALCEVGGGNCEDFLEQPGGREVPPAAPRIIGGRTIQPTSEGGGGSVGGYVLEMCGTNAEGATYDSEMIVFFDFNGTLRGIEPTYWLGIRIADDRQAGLHLDGERTSACP